MKKYWLVNPVEAVRFHPEDMADVLEFTADDCQDLRYSSKTQGCTVDTGASLIFVPDGSWLVRIAPSQYHVMSHDLFVELYRETDELRAAQDRWVERLGPEMKDG